MDQRLDSRVDQVRFGSLFAGIGGIDLGLERAGMECTWQVEIDDYCTRVLAKHWPDVPRYGDIRGLTPPAVDLIAGGFPCQPHSIAGKRKGAEDDRNLWPEFRRVIAELRPRYVLAENVPGIVSTYIDTVLSDLESQGYTCATLNLPAMAFDAPHRRERIFVVAYSSSDQLRDKSGRRSGESRAYPPELGDNGKTELMADTDRTWELQQQGNEQTQRGRIGDGSEVVADTEREGFRFGIHEDEEVFMEGSSNGETGGPIPTCSARSYWTVEPDVGRVAHGIPSRVDRLRGLGNAVVPQVAEWIGKRILEHDEASL